MKEFLVKSFSELHDTLNRYLHDSKWIFRGHSNPEWLLVPKIGRASFWGQHEKGSFEGWKRRAVEYVSVHPDNDWGWLAIAQHHGLATRLLDWTFNPLAAAFFAVWEHEDNPAVLFAFRPTKVVTTEKVHPLDFSKVALFKPIGVVPRITRQGGLFTVHGEPNVPLEDSLDNKDELEKIVIAQEYRDQLVFELSYYGINRATLFPDLDGLSTHLNWITANRAYWQGSI
jgi:hypothetical protein